MVLKKLYLLLFVVTFFIFLLFSTCAYGTNNKKDTLEDVIIKTIERNMDISITYRRCDGHVFTGLNFYDISFYKGKQKFFSAKKLKWVPKIGIKTIKDPLSFLHSFSCFLEKPVLYFDTSSIYTNLPYPRDYKIFFKKLKEYKIKLNIKDGLMIIPDWYPISINGVFDWEGILKISNALIRIGNGKVILDGDVDLFFENPKTSLHMKASHIPSLLPYYYKGSVDFDIFVKSFRGNPKLKGTLDLYNGTIFIKEGGGTENLFINPYFDILARLKKNITISGGIHYNFKGRGLFKLTYSLKIPKLIGEFIIESGKVLFGNRYFNTAGDKIEFVDYNYLDPLLFIDAQGNVDGVKIFANIRGTAHKPKVLLSSIPPFSQNELSSLIMIGKRIEDYQDIKNLNEFLADESLNIAFRTLSLKFINSMNEIGREYLGLDTFYLEPSFEIYPNNIIKTRLTLKVGKYIEKNFYIKYERVLTPYVDDLFGFEFYPGKGFYVDFSIDKKNNIQVELIYEYTF